LNDLQEGESQLRRDLERHEAETDSEPESRSGR
jgi:hypothetical protein